MITLPQIGDQESATLGETTRLVGLEGPESLESVVLGKEYRVSRIFDLNGNKSNVRTGSGEPDGYATVACPECKTP